MNLIKSENRRKNFCGKTVAGVSWQHQYRSTRWNISPLYLRECELKWKWPILCSRKKIISRTSGLNLSSVCDEVALNFWSSVPLPKNGMWNNSQLRSLTMCKGLMTNRFPTKTDIQCVSWTLWIKGKRHFVVWLVQKFQWVDIIRKVFRVVYPVLPLLCKAGSVHNPATSGICCSM